MTRRNKASLAAFLCTLCPSDCWSPAVDRRTVLQSVVLPFGVVSAPITASAAADSVVVPSNHRIDSTHVEHPFRYSNEWTGTNLPILSLEEAANKAKWDMARWPDPSLRIAAASVPPHQFGSKPLQNACDRLRETAIANDAVGLAAQQCGVNARMVYLQHQSNVLINPMVLERSSEAKMRVWTETCLVLPPNFQATVLRDDWVTVQFNDWQGRRYRQSFHGETARAVQHEMDHDRGILITDHIEPGEMENDVMRSIERMGHEDRMRAAFERYVADA